MTAVLLSASASNAADNQRSTFVGDAEYYGEEYAEIEQSSDDIDYADNEKAGVSQASAGSYIGDDNAAPAQGVRAAPAQGVRSAPAQGVRSATMHSPTAPTYRPAGMRTMHTQQSLAAPCSVGCDKGCDSGCGVRGQMSKMMCGKNPTMWLQAETLLWFPQARTSFPLAVVTNLPGELPVLSTPGATPVGEQFGNNLSPGFRGDMGRYFADGAFGIGGRVWFLSEDDDSFNLSSDGTDRSIGRPFNNIGGGPNPDAAFIAFQPGLAPFLGYQGNISAQASISMVAAEAYGRISLGGNKMAHTDLIGGFSYFGIDDDLSIQSQTRLVPGTGGTFNFTDSFNTTNDFFGGQIGAESILRRGRWVARSLTKVHLGNMSQNVNISGTGTTTDTNVSPIDAFGDGFLAGGANGSFDRDIFTFAPELNLKLGYRFRDHVTFNVGYSFLYWSNVALAGNQIDPNFAVTNTGVTRPDVPFSIRQSGYWVQGVDLGATIEF